MDRNIRLLSIGIAIRTFGSAMYNPFLALFLYSVMGIGYLEIGTIFAALGVIQLPFALVGGLWSDRIGRRPLIVLSLATEALFTGGLAYAFQIRSLALAIGLAAVGGSVLASTGAAFSAYIADHSSGSDRTRAFTWYRITFNAGYSAGVTLGGILVGFAGFPISLLIASLMIAVAAIFVVTLLEASPYDRRLKSGEPPKEGAPAAPATGRTLRQSLDILAQDRPALLVAAGFGLAYLVSSQWSVIFPLFVHNKLGIGYSLLGIGLALNGVIVVVGQAFTTESLIGRRHTSIAILGVALYVVAFLLLGAAALWVLLPAAAFLVAVVVLTFGENIGSIPISTLPSNLAPEGEVGSYNGGINTVLAAAAISGTFFGGAVLSGISNPLLEWVILCLPAIPAAILLRWAAGRIPIEKDRA